MIQKGALIYRTARILGGSWVVRSGVISRVTVLITHIKGLITLHISTHEPPSRLNTRPRVSSYEVLVGVVFSGFVQGAWGLLEV